VSILNSFWARLQGLTRHEWLFICDNIEAIFRNDERDPSGVIDCISRSGILNEPKEVSKSRGDSKFIESFVAKSLTSNSTQFPKPREDHF
jgi:hypothetical protein